MRTYLDCIPCFFKQALESAKLAGAGAKTQRKILNEVAKKLPAFSLKSSPPEMGKIVYGTVARMTGRKDPYKKIKEEGNRRALRLYEGLKGKVRRSRQTLLTAVELAIAGNIIDYGVKNSLDVDKELKKIMHTEASRIREENKRVFDYTGFKRALREAKTILYLGDNAGETVFDRILIEEIKRLYRDKRIIYAVKEKPIINDALAKDAKDCGIDKTAEVISSGLDIPGTALALCSKKFLNVYKKADMVISKGQGNFEALSDAKKRIFFLFMAKCPVVAEHVSCSLGDIILLSNT